MPTFELTSPDFEQGDALPTWARAGYAGGDDRSPALAWRGAPEGTKSFVLTLFDPDAPRAGGWWHWVVCDLPGDLDSLSRNAGDPDAGLLPAGTVTHPNEEGHARYDGAGPPPGHGPHRYVFTLSALDVDRLDVDPSAAATEVGAAFRDHLLGQAELTGTSETS
jgi:Raf kinase inhibitor-like YbhB/YbcL family protein